MIRAADSYEGAEHYLPARITLKTLREAAQGCRGCDLYRNATQAVIGEGPAPAPIMFVGEQPGEQEDLAGRPFVGPAGRMFDKALAEVGIERREVFVTNAVKHFKFTPRGKRRIHGKPTMRQVRACRPWLEAEIALVQPQMIVAMGATAAQALFGTAFRVSTQRGEPFECDWAPWCMATVHPSSLLRAPDEESRRAMWARFVEDMQIVAAQYRKTKSKQKARMRK